METNDVLLTLKGVSKDFGGLRALNRVDLGLKKGVITALIGPNGAGKTTLINIISGVYGLSEGSVLFEGKSIDGLRSHEIAGMGISRTFQLTKLFGGMSVLENVMTNMEEDKDLRLTMNLVEESEGNNPFVELVVWYDGQDGVIRNIQKAFGPEGGLNFENLTLAMALARKVMVRNQGEMRVNQEESDGTTILLHFQIAG